MRTLDDLDVDGKRVLVRVDFNVPLDGDGGSPTTPASRPRCPTLRELRSKGARQLVLLAHLGRPKGRDEKFSLAPVGRRACASCSDVDVALAPEPRRRARTARS